MMRWKLRIHQAANRDQQGRSQKNLHPVGETNKQTRWLQGLLRAMPKRKWSRVLGTEWRGHSGSGAGDVSEKGRGPLERRWQNEFSGPEMEMSRCL